MSYDNKGKITMTAMQFQGFKPQAMERIAGTLGYQGDMSKFKDFLSSDPDAQNKFNDFQTKAITSVFDYSKQTWQ